MRTSPRLLAAAVLSCTLVLGCTHRSVTVRPKVGIVVPNTTLNVSKEMGEGFVAGARLGGGDGTVVGPPIVNPMKQVELFKELKGSARNGVAVAASSPELFAEALADAGKDGLPLIAVDAKPAATAHVKLFIGNDNYALGQLLADEAIRRLPAGAPREGIHRTPAPGRRAPAPRGAGRRAAARAALS